MFKTIIFSIAFSALGISYTPLNAQNVLESLNDTAVISTEEALWQRPTP